MAREKILLFSNRLPFVSSDFISTKQPFAAVINPKIETQISLIYSIHVYNLFLTDLNTVSFKESNILIHLQKCILKVFNKELYLLTVLNCVYVTWLVCAWPVVFCSLAQVLCTVLLLSNSITSWPVPQPERLYAVHSCRLNSPGRVLIKELSFLAHSVCVYKLEGFCECQTVEKVS